MTVESLKVITENPLSLMIGLFISAVMSVLGIYLLVLRIQEITIKNKKEKLEIKKLELNSDETYVVDLYDESEDIYKVAKRLLMKESIESIFLCQVSSTILLGPSVYNKEEENFYREMRSLLNDGKIKFYHITSVNGCKKVLANTDSFFQIDKAFDNLLDTNNNDIALKIGLKGILSAVKVIENNKESTIPNFSPYLFVKYGNGDTDGLFITQIGNTRMSIHLRGIMVDSIMKDSIRFYDSLKTLSKNDYNYIIGKNNNE